MNAYFSLPCVKGGGTACCDGGIVNAESHRKQSLSRFATAPFTQGSLFKASSLLQR